MDAGDTSSTILQCPRRAYIYLKEPLNGGAALGRFGDGTQWSPPLVRLDSSALNWAPGYAKGTDLVLFYFFN